MLFDIRRLKFSFRNLLAIAVVLMVTGCFHNDSSPAPTPDQDATGIYSGSANLDGSDYGDLKGIISNNRLMIFSISADVLYDGIISSISGDDFTASVNIYINGALDGQSPRTVTGKVMSASHFNGSFASGTGMANGSFEMLYHDDNDKPATFERVDTDTNLKFTGVLYTTEDIESDFHFFDAPDNLFDFIDNDVTICYISGVSLTYSDQINVYDLNNEFTILDGNACNYAGQTGHTGKATLVGTDNELWVAFSNGSNGFYAVATRP